MWSTQSQRHFYQDDDFDEPPTPIHWEDAVDPGKCNEWRENSGTEQQSIIDNDEKVHCEENWKKK